MAGCTQKRAYLSPQVPADGPVCTPRAAQSTCLPLPTNDIARFRSPAGPGRAVSHVVRCCTSGGRLLAGAVGPVRPYGAILPPPSARAPSVHEATDGHAVRRPLPLRLPCPPCGVHDHRHNKFKDNDLQNASWKPLRLSSPLSIDCFARC